MAKRYDVMFAKKIEGRDKPMWLRCGVAFEKDSGQISIKLEMLPIGTGEIWLSLFEPRQKDQAPAAPSAQEENPFGDDGGLF